MDTRRLVTVLPHARRLHTIQYSPHIGCPIMKLVAHRCQGFRLFSALSAQPERSDRDHTSAYNAHSYALVMTFRIALGRNNSWCAVEVDHDTVYDA